MPWYATSDISSYLVILVSGSVIEFVVSKASWTKFDFNNITDDYLELPVTSDDLYLFTPFGNSAFYNSLESK